MILIANGCSHTAGAEIEATYNYKVGPHWLDFAIVEHKIAIECDGAYWHKDEEKDKLRDQKLEAQGWSALIQLKDGIESTYQWYKDSY